MSKKKVIIETVKETNQELGIKENKNKKEEIVMNDKKEVKETTKGAVKASIIPENEVEEIIGVDGIEDFEEEIDLEEMARLEEEGNKIFESIGAEVRAKVNKAKNEEIIEEEDEINLDSELVKFLCDYNCDNKHIKSIDLRLKKVTPECWQLSDFDTGNILWEGNAKDAIGGYIGFFMEKLSDLAGRMMDGTTLEVAIQRGNNKE